MTASSALPSTRRSALRRRNTWLGWSFILPNFVGFAVWTLIPIVVLFGVAFTDWSALGAAHWVGIDNFTRMVGDPTFHTALANTFVYAVVHIPVTLVVALGLAVLLNQRLRGVAFFRTAAFFPYITSIVAIAVVWNLMFSPEYGPINQVLSPVFSALGADLPGWTVSASPWTGAMPAILIVGTWREMGYYMLLFLAGLQTIPPELYEAAKIDGANSLRRFWHITWAGLRPTTFFVTVMLTIGSFKVFDLILVMTGGGPGTATMVLSQLIYRRAFEEGRFGYASAVSMVLFIICLMVTIIQFLVNRRTER